MFSVACDQIDDVVIGALLKFEIRQLEIISFFSIRFLRVGCEMRAASQRDQDQAGHNGCDETITLQSTCHKYVPIDDCRCRPMGCHFT